MVEVAGRPFADHQLASLSRWGVTDVVYSIGHRGGQIENHVGDGSQYGLSVRYVADGDRLMGTGGALRRVWDEGLLQDSFLVMYGDTLLQADLPKLLEALRLRPACDAVMAIFENHDTLDASNVVCLAGGLVHYDKSRPADLLGSMTHIDYGVMAIRGSVIEELVEPDRVTDLADVLRMLSERRMLAGLEVHDRFFEIGTPQSLAELDAHLRATE